MFITGLLLLALAQVAMAQADFDRFITGEMSVPADAPVVLGDSGERAAARSRYAGRLHSSLVELIEAQARGAGNLAAASDVPARLIDGNRVLVEVRFRRGVSLGATIRALGGSIRHSLNGGIVEAWLPIAALEALAADEDVGRVWPATLVQPQAGSETTQGLAAGQAGPWHAGGLDGSGVTIAIIDQFNDTGGEVSSLQSSGDWPSSGQLTTIKFGGGSFGSNGIPHGNAVLEIAFDIAPGADFIAYDGLTVGDWIDAINDAVSRGADVISASLGAPLNGIGDGSARPGSVAEAVEDAAAAGVLYVNSAGNSRQTHWGGLYSPSGSGGDVHGFTAGGQQINYHGPGDGNIWCLGNGAPLRGELFWADWNDVDHDYALVLFEYDGSNWVEIDRADATQSGFPELGQTPQEFLSISAASAYSGTCGGTGAGAYGWAVIRNSAPSDLNLQFFSPVPLDERVFNRSLTFPADSPSAISVAALDVGTSAQEAYSSQGPILAPGGGLPTGSEYAKPDVASFANVDTVSYGPGVFNGTSSAAPHVAGMAALLTQLHPGETRAERLSRLHAISGIGSNDLGSAGHEFRHGYGRTRFQLESSLAVTQQPTDVAVGATIGPVGLEVRDDEGLVVLSGPTRTLDAAIGSDPSGGAATLAGTTTRAVSDGLASFDDLSIDTAGTGYTLGVSSAGPGPAETNSFNVTAGTPTRLSFSVQPSNTTAGAVITPPIVVQVLDDSGNVVVSDDSTQVELAIVAGPGSATLSGGGPVTVSNGEASFDNVSIDVAATGYQLEARDVGASLSSDTSTAFDVVPGDPAALRFDVQPSNAEAGQAISPAIVVQVIDAAGNHVTDDNSTQVELSIATGPGDATLSGGGPVTVSGGEASFGSVSIDVADTGYQLQAADSGSALTTDTSTSFDITPGPPDNLAFGVQPSETQVNESVTPAIVVEVRDSLGNVVTDDNSTFVELSIAAGPGSATLSGGGPVLVNSGEAVFGSASIDVVATGYQLEATDSVGSLTPGTSASFDIIAGDPASLRFVVQPSDTIVNDPIEPAVTVEVLDANGNRVAWDNSTQVELLLSGGGGGTLSGGGPVTVADGLAQFAALSVDTAGVDYQLEAVDGASALAGDNSTLFDIIVDVIFSDRFEASSE